MAKYNILYLALNFPKIGTGNNLYTDLMEEFRDQGHSVYVLASSLETGTSGYQLEAGLHVIRAKVPEHQNVGNIKKGISNLMLPYAYQSAFKKHFPKEVDIDFIIMPTPPITLTHLAKKLKQQFNAKFYLILRDIFPQNAVDLGFMTSNGLLHRYFRSVESKLYKTADYIGCMSQGNIDYVKNHNPNVAQEKLHILRNWQRELALSKASKTELKSKFKTSGKFVLFFGGNIGKPQKIENLIKLALLYQNTPEVLLFIVGKGTEAEKLNKLIAKHNLNNVIFKDYLPRDAYFEVIQMADLGLITLDERFTIPNLPSKALSYFNTKLPVVAITDQNTDFGPWIQDEVGAGYWFTNSNMELVKSCIDSLRMHPEEVKKLGEKGYAYFCNKLLPNHAYNQIIKQLQNDDRI